MDILKREEYLTTGINSIMEDSVFLDEPHYDWRVNSMEHKTMWTYVEAVRLSSPYRNESYTEVKFIATFHKGLPPEILAIYVVEKGNWSLLANSSGMKFPGSLGPAEKFTGTKFGRKPNQWNA